MIIGPLNTPFQRDPNKAPTPHSKFGVCDEGNPASVQGNPDDVSVLSQVFYTKTEGLRNSPAALNTPFGTAITGIGKPKGA